MDIIKNVLMDKKFYEAEEQVAEFLEKNEIDPNSFIQSFIFDSEIFKDAAEVREWIESHYFNIKNGVEEKGKTFVVMQVESSEFMDGSMKTIDIRTGVKAEIGILKSTVMDGSECTLSLRNDDTINLSANMPHVIELCKVISGYHPSYGQIEIKQEHLKEMVTNFRENAVGIDLSINLDHEKREAVAWIKDVFLNYEQTTLLGEVYWCPDGAKALADKSFRYFSPEFRFDYVHPHTGKEHGATLLGGALVNHPFLKMDAIVNLSNKDAQEKKKMEKTIELKEHTEKVEKLDKKIADLELSEKTSKNVIAGLKTENLELKEKVEKIENEKSETERVGKLDILFKDNKINKAQYDVLKENKDKDLFDVLELGGKLNTNASGKGGANDESEINLNDEEKAVCAKLDLTPEEYKKYNN